MAILFFDLDGTLSDPREGFALSIRHALDTLDASLDPSINLEAMIGPPLRSSFRSMFDDEESVERGVAYYRETYEAVGWRMNRLYPGVDTMLQRMHGTGQRLFVVTSKMTHFAQRILEYHDLARYFEQIFGTDADGTNDNKADLLRGILSDLGVSPGSATMIGDRKEDIAAGRLNNVATIGVLYGFGSREELEQAGADVLCERPEDIPSLVANQRVA